MTFKLLQFNLHYMRAGINRKSTTSIWYRTQQRLLLANLA